MSEMQYQATIKNGDIKSEDGYFFKAGSFEVKSDDSTFLCEFNRLENGSVVWHIKKEKESIYKLTHPDYVPESEPGKNINIETIEEKRLKIFDAFDKLDISKDKAYKTFFEEYKKLDYQIIQHKLLS